MNVNLYGAVRLANAVLPAMRAAGGGRFIATSSVAGLVAMPMMPVYASTKFALEGFMESMAAAYAGIGIHFSIVEPGPVDTGFMGNAKGAAQAPAELRPGSDAFQTAMTDMMSEAQASDECDKFFLKAVTDAHPQLRYLTYEPMAPLLRAKYVDLTGKESLETLKSMVAPPAKAS